MTNWLMDIPSAQYHADDANGTWVGSHSLIDFGKCPAKYDALIRGLLPRKNCDALSFGIIAHKLILEGPQTFDEEFVVARDEPVNPKTGKAYGPDTAKYQEYLAGLREKNPGKEIVGLSQFEAVYPLQFSVTNNPVAMDLLVGAVPEKTIRTNIDGVNVQCRPDKINTERKYFVDLKTIEEIECAQLDSIKFHYYEQMAFYQELIRAVSGDTYDCYLIFVEKSGIHRSKVFKVCQTDLDKASELNHEHLAELMQCRHDNKWPTRCEGLHYLTRETKNF